MGSAHNEILETIHYGRAYHKSDYQIFQSLNFHLIDKITHHVRFHSPDSKAYHHRNYHFYHGQYFYYHIHLQLIANRKMIQQMT